MFREILDLVQRTHAAGASAEPERLLRAAARAVVRARSGVKIASRPDGFHVNAGGTHAVLAPAASESLGEALERPLQSLLDLASGDDAASRNALRALMLDAMLKSLDPWSSAVTGRKRSDRETRRTGRKAGAPAGASVTFARRDDGIAVVGISHFSRRTPSEVEAVLAAADAGPPRGIVLDLRGNTGGSMLGAAGVADLFLSSGVVCEALDDRDRPVPGLAARVEATPGGDVTTPLAVLVDRRTGSSAELLAAALAWNDRAIIAGERTFGKIVVGKPHSFEELDLTVTITTAVLRAAGRRLPKEGLMPDHEIDPAAPDALDRVAQQLGPS